MGLGSNHRGFILSKPNVEGNRPVGNLGTPYLIQPILIPLIVVFGSWLLLTYHAICFPFYAGNEILAAQQPAGVFMLSD